MNGMPAMRQCGSVLLLLSMVAVTHAQTGTVIRQTPACRYFSVTLEKSVDGPPLVLHGVAADGKVMQAWATREGPTNVVYHTYAGALKMDGGKIAGEVQILTSTSDQEPMVDDPLPMFRGGITRVTLDLAITGGSVTGTYTGKLKWGAAAKPVEKAR